MDLPEDITVSIKIIFMRNIIKKIVGVSVISGLVLVAVPVLAQLDTGLVPATNDKAGRTVIIPDHAVGVADNVFSLGAAVDPQTGKTVEGIMIIDDRQKNAKGGAKGKPDKPGGSGGETCYAYLASGAKWRTTEDYIVDASNVDGMSASFVRSAIATAVDAWDSEASTDVFGVETAGVVDGADEFSPDGRNEVLFADIDSPGAVGVTIVWGVFRGRPSNRMLVEWDQVYDDRDFDFDFDFGDATLDPSVMDFLNVAVHEVGHAAGMGHPSDGCVDETMYRFVSVGEIIKRDLNMGDIAGIANLY